MKINIHTSYPSAFISSTFIDLHEERRHVAEILREAGLNINALEVKPAANNSAQREILRGIKESDFMILVIGERYGTIFPNSAGSNLSFTKWEYNMGVKIHRRNALVFFKNVTSNEAIHYDDRASKDFEFKQQLLKAFKSELSRSHSPKYFSTPEELAQEVKKALIPTYRSGVRELIARNETRSREIDDLNRKIESLNQEVQRLSTVLQNLYLSSSMMDHTNNDRSSGLVGTAAKLADNQNNPAALGLTRLVRGGLIGK